MNSAQIQELLIRARQGDGAALGRLLDHYRAYLRLLAQRRLEGRARGRVDASDVVQQTYLEAHRDFERFFGQGEAEFLGWLRQILEHNAANTLERHVFTQKRTVDREQSFEVDHDEPGAIVPQPAAPNTSPSRRAMLGEAAVRLAQALETLPAEQREAIRLRHLEGWSLAQLAAHFDRSETAVAGLLKRGLRGLRNAFRGDENQDAL
jgi:RNA polymerase sigma-70 factor (ECF subfamily)